MVWGVPHSWLPQTSACRTSLVRDTLFRDNTTTRRRNYSWDDSCSSCELLWRLHQAPEDMSPLSLDDRSSLQGKEQISELVLVSALLIILSPFLHFPTSPWGCIRNTYSGPRNNQREDCKACDLRVTTKQFCCESWCSSSYTSVVVIQHVSLLFLCKRWWDYLEITNTVQIKKPPCSMPPF